MAKPIPTPQQVEALNAVKFRKNAKKTTLLAAATAQDSVIAEAALVDSAFKDLFDWYNDAIIVKYDAERKSIDGQYIASPITNTDINNVAAVPPSGRLTPTPPAIDVVRVAEFDGSPLISTTTNEQQHISNQTSVESQLQVGFPGTDPTINASTVTDGAFSGVSTSLLIRDTIDEAEFTIGDVFPINDGTTAALVQVTSVTETTLVPSVAPFLYTLGVTVLIPPVGTIALGSELRTDWHGFNNAQRTTKIASFAPYQNFMNVLVARLETHINNRIARLNEQIPAIQANEDPYETASLATALAAAQTSKTFLTTYLLTTIISDLGIADLVDERGDRSPYLTTRLAEISAAYTGGTIDFYDARYDLANGRGNTARGTLREQRNAENVKSLLQNMAAAEQDAIDAFDVLLGL